MFDNVAKFVVFHPLLIAYTTFTLACVVVFLSFKIFNLAYKNKQLRSRLKQDEENEYWWNDGVKPQLETDEYWWNDGSKPESEDHYA